MIKELVTNFIKLSILFFPLFFLFSAAAYLLKEKIPIDKMLKAIPFGVRNVAAALFGVLTPFCSCITIPIFINMVEIGVPADSAVAFLIASPLVSIAAVVFMASLFGVKFVLYYLISVIAISVIGGIIIARKAPVRINNSDCNGATENSCPKAGPLLSAFNLLRRLFVYLAIGVAVAAIMHNYLPAGAVEKINNFPLWGSIPLAALIGFPLYANVLVVIPLCFSLAAKGINGGIIATFLMSACGISLPSAVILAKIFSKRGLALFLITTFLAYILVGYAFNLLH